MQVLSAGSTGAMNLSLFGIQDEPFRSKMMNTSASESSSISNNSAAYLGSSVDRLGEYRNQIAPASLLSFNNNHRRLDEFETWEIAFTSVILVIMLGVLMTDKYGSDSVMIIALAFFLCSGIISVKEGVAGFSNSSVLTIMVLFIVAQGITKTGALDWYVGKFLGKPKTIESAQLRLMLPIVFVSTFMSNTPIVAIMVPVIQRWAKNCRLPVEKLLMPLSFATILGGTCSVIGTSTNLVVLGLLQNRYPNDPSTNIRIFDLAVYGVPNALVGLSYILFFSPYLLATRKNMKRASSGDDDAVADEENVLLSAKVTQWSPAAGHTISRSGLRDHGGIYLVSAKRATTRSVLHVVSSDYVIDVGDTLYFTGVVEEFAEFCEQNGLQIVTNDEDALSNNSQSYNAGSFRNFNMSADNFDLPDDVGISKDSLIRSDDIERLRAINRITETIRGQNDSDDDDDFRSVVGALDPAQSQIVVTANSNLVVIAIDAPERLGLLPDIGEHLQSLGLRVHHTEANVVENRSLSIWRCEPENNRVVNDTRIWTSLHEFLQHGKKVKPIKRKRPEATLERGLRVIRATVVHGSTLIGKTPLEVDFRKTYKASPIATNVRTDMKKSKKWARKTIAEGDTLLLSASNNSPLLIHPPEGFYDYLRESHTRSFGASTLLGGSVHVSKSTNGPLSNSRKASLLFRKNQDWEAKSFDGDSDSGDQDSGSLDESTLHIRIPSSLSKTRQPPLIRDFRESDSLDALSSHKRKSALLRSRNGGESDSLDALSSHKRKSPHLRSVFQHTIAEDFDEVLRSVPSSDFSDEQKESVWKDLKVNFNDDGATKSVREFLTAVVIAKRSRLAGKTVSQAGIDKLPDLFLVSVERKEEKKKRRFQNIRQSIAAFGMRSSKKRDDNSSLSSSGRPRLSRQQSMKVGFKNNLREALVRMESFSTKRKTEILIPVQLDEPLKVGDILWYSGPANAIGDLRRIPGLASYENDHVKKIKDHIHDRRLVQAVIGRQGPLVGKTVRDVKFATRYGAAVIAIHRDGNRVHEHAGNVKLQAGDVLLLEAGPSFVKKSAEGDLSFALLAEVKDSAPPRLQLLVPAVFLIVGMLAAYLANLADLFICTLVCSILMVCFGIISEQEAREALNWKVYITISSAFGIGQAMKNSGVATAITKFLVHVGGAINLGQTGYIGVVYLATFLLSNLLENTAAVAIIFPVAMDAAESSGTSLVLMSFALMLGSSASFMTPYGFTVNLLIYGPGNYKYMDYVRFGGPLQIYLWLLATSFLGMKRPFYSWFGALALFGLVVIISVLDVFGKCRGTSSKDSSLDDGALSPIDEERGIAVVCFCSGKQTDVFPTIIEEGNEEEEQEAKRAPKSSSPLGETTAVTSSSFVEDDRALEVVCFCKNP